MLHGSSSLQTVVKDASPAGSFGISHFKIHIDERIEMGHLESPLKTGHFGSLLMNI